jgi:5'-AMP-activated protein kinase regulatory gamma subunit
MVNKNISKHYNYLCTYVNKTIIMKIISGVRAAPLWDSSGRGFVGMLTITDFIRVLHAMYHDSAGKIRLHA